MTTGRSAFVGRDAELAFVAECIAAALAGNPLAVLCEGEAGIGKTRLAEDVISKASGRGMLGVWGVAENAAGTPPFWPWIRVLRALSQRLDLPALVGPGNAAILSTLLPELLGASKAPAAAQSGESSEARFRQFDALALLLHDLCEATPLAIVIDDAHWADAASLRALAHVVTGLASERLLIWVNSRVTGGHDTALLERWVHMPHARQLSLSGLTHAAIQEQLIALIGADVSPDDVEDTHAATGGNPFFVGEVARMLLERRATGATMRPSRRVVGALQARLDQLTGTAANAVRAASILGQEFDVNLLTNVLGAAPLDVVMWLEQARGFGLVEPALTAGRYRFAHALVRDAVEAGIDGAERVRLHRRTADAIEQRHGTAAGAHVFALAQHWAAAAAGGDGDHAARWLAVAGDAAMRQLAYEDAAQLYADALRIGAGALSDEDRYRMLLGQARAAASLGALSVGFTAAMDAADVARRLGRIDLVAEAALVMEPVGIPGFDLSLRRLCQEVMAAPRGNPSSLRARITARFAETYIYLPDSEDARRASVDALAIADASNDRAALAAALRARQVVIADPEGLDEREELMNRMVQLGQGVGDASLELRGRLGLADAGFERGDLGGVAHQLQAAAQCAADHGGPFARFRVLQAEAVLAQAQGRFSSSREKVEQAVWTMRATDHHEPILMQGAVLSALGRHTGFDEPMLVAMGVQAGPGAPDRDMIMMAGIIAAVSMAATLVSVQRLDEAAALYASLGPPSSWKPPPHVVLLVLALGLEVALALAKDGDTAVLRDRLDAYRGHHVACGLIAASYAGPVELWLGKAARHLGRYDEAVSDLDDASQRAARGGAAGFAVEAQAELAAALLGRRRSGDAAWANGVLASARADADRLGMRPWSQWIAGMGRSLDAQYHTPLTRREREIADLVAAGLTNRQIAELLFLSERTAQNHVQHILDKLGLDNRSQIAVWAHRFGGSLHAAQKMSIPKE